MSQRAFRRGMRDLELARPDEPKGSVRDDFRFPEGPRRSVRSPGLIVGASVRAAAHSAIRAGLPPGGDRPVRRPRPPGSLPHNPNRPRGRSASNRMPVSRVSRAMPGCTSAQSRITPISIAEWRQGGHCGGAQADVIEKVRSPSTVADLAGDGGFLPRKSAGSAEGFARRLAGQAAANPAADTGFFAGSSGHTSPERFGLFSTILRGFPPRPIFLGDGTDAVFLGGDGAMVGRPRTRLSNTSAASDRWAGCCPVRSDHRDGIDDRRSLWPRGVYSGSTWSLMGIGPG